jgi:hypothetical protein
MRSLALRIKLLVLFLGMTLLYAQPTKNGDSDCGTEEFDIKAAEIAWNYFENNYNPETGLVNGTHKYKVIRPEHIGHTIMATIAVKKLGIISPSTFHDRMKKLVGTLTKLKVYRNELPNVYYDAKTAKMVEKSGKVSYTGNGWDLYSVAQMVTALYHLQRDFPVYREDVFGYVASWNTKRAFLEKGMENRWFNGKDKGGSKPVKDVAKEYYIHSAFNLFNFQSFSHFVETKNLEYKAPYRHEVPMGFKHRLANGESYLWSMMAHPYYLKYKHYSSNIYMTLKDRYEITGKIATSTEEAIDSKPHWVSNNIYNNGKLWNDLNRDEKTVKGKNIISTKAAFVYDALYGYKDSFAKVLMEEVAEAYKDGFGWYGGKYSKSGRINKSLNSATNSAVLQALLYKRTGNFYYAKEAKLFDKVARHHFYVPKAYYIESNPIELRYDAQQLMKSIKDEEQIVRVVQQKDYFFVVRIGAFEDHESAETYLSRMDVVVQGAKIKEGIVNSDNFMQANRYYNYDYRYPYKNMIISKENKPYKQFLKRYKAKKKVQKQKKT